MTHKKIVKHSLQRPRLHRYQKTEFANRALYLLPRATTLTMTPHICKKRARSQILTKVCHKIN